MVQQGLVVDRPHFKWILTEISVYKWTSKCVWIKQADFNTMYVEHTSMLKC